MWKKISPFLLPSIWDIGSLIGTWFPTIVVVATAAIGAIQNIPWIIILVAASVSFGACSVGIYYFSEWLQKRSIISKLHFRAPRVLRAHDQSAICLGFELASTADFEIECEVTEITTRVGDRVPMKQEKLPQIFTVPPHGMIFFDGSLIEFDPAAATTLEGRMKFKVQYGRAGHRTQSMSGSKIVYLGINPEGDLIAPPSWVDAVE